MAKRPQSRLPDPALAVLTPERRQHDPVRVVDGTFLDERGAISQPYRVQSRLERMVAQKDITEGMRAAGEDFHRVFRLSMLHPLRAADLLQEVRYAAPASAHRSERARMIRDEALDVLGGMGSAAGSCAWHVLGEEMTLRDWAIREGWSQRPLNQNAAHGVLLGTLGCLEAFFARGRKKI